MTTPGSHGPDQPSGGGGPGRGQPPAGPPGGYSPPPPPPPGGATPPPPPPGGFGQPPYQPQGQPYPQQGQPYPPQGQPYPPQGQPYPPQGQPYPPQGQPYPPQGQPYPPQGQPYPPQPGGFGAPQKSGRPKWLIPVIGGVVLVAAALALFAFFGSGTPEVGDCLDSDSGEPEIVDCGDSSAVLKIIGEHDEELTTAEFLSDPSVCEDFVEQTEYVLWYGDTEDSDAEGTVFCTEYVND